MQPRSRRVAACSLAGLQALASSPLTRIPPCLRLRHDMRGATGAQPSPAAPSRLAPPVSSTSGPSRYSVELPCPPRPSLQPTTTMCSSKGAEEPGPLPPPAAKPSPKRNEPKITATDASARWSTSRTNQPSKKGRRRVRLGAQKERRGRDARAAVTAVTAAQPLERPGLHFSPATVRQRLWLERQGCSDPPLMVSLLADALAVARPPETREWPGESSRPGYSVGPRNSRGLVDHGGHDVGGELRGAPPAQRGVYCGGEAAFVKLAGSFILSTTKLDIYWNRLRFALCPPPPHSHTHTHNQELRHGVQTRCMYARPSVAGSASASLCAPEGKGRRARGAARSRLGLPEPVAPAAPSDPKRR